MKTFNHIPPVYNVWGNQLATGKTGSGPTKKSCLKYGTASGEVFVPKTWQTKTETAMKGRLKQPFCGDYKIPNSHLKSTVNPRRFEGAPPSSRSRATNPPMAGSKSDTALLTSSTFNKKALRTRTGLMQVNMHSNVLQDQETLFY